MAGLNRVLIVGAGMAGLSLSIALQRAGIVPDIVERAAEWPPHGAGIYLVGNAMRALDSLGVADVVLSKGSVIGTQTIRTDRGRKIVEIDVESVWAECGPCVAIRRADLQDALIKAMSLAKLRFSTKVMAIDQRDSYSVARFSDGTEVEYDLIVGADGINSSIREHLFDHSKPSFCGQVAWRFLTRCPPSIASWTVFIGKSDAFLIIPVGDGQAYCYADTSLAEPTSDPVEGRLDRLRARFQGFAHPVSEALAGLTSPDQVHFGPIEEILQQPWSAGNVLLIGDAAHASAPNMASGAAMAFEDSLVLSRLIAAGGTAEQVISAYTDQRLARVKWVQDQTHKRDRLRAVPPIIRNLLTRVMFTRAYQSNYAPLLKEL